MIVRVQGHQWEETRSSNAVVNPKGVKGKLKASCEEANGVGRLLT